MFTKKKNVRPNLPKEYIFTLEIDGEEKLYKCLVKEDEVITFEGDVEHKHLKITNPVCEEGVLQIDTTTKIYGEMIEFQLERFIPYIRLEGHWVMSDTTEDDRMKEQIAIYNRQAKFQVITGVICLLITGIYRLITGDFGNLWMLSIFGIFFITAAAMQTVRLKQEINAIEEAKQAAAAAKEAKLRGVEE